LENIHLFLFVSYIILEFRKQFVDNNEMVHLSKTRE
jgi:hypothetical protein